ncbi:metabolite traffic protein EboE [Planctomicrobium sp. SH661]|uniref:metabolite traffic protein EboE n=1 Tax=Planctomicrobium sp. SH661 TaxID=3448124 RepID=UPI003F5AFFA2
MSLSTLPLSYCTNVHPGKTVAEVVAKLREHTIPAREKLQTRIAAGLWLAASVVEELEQAPQKLDLLKEALHEGDLVCYTLNTFPFGDFHSERVKENVYVPDWSAPARLAYTQSSAKILAELMPVGVEGSLSTVPLGFKGFEHPADFVPRCIDQLLSLANSLDQLHDETGRIIRLAIEPEPCCVLETTPESIQFFQQLFAIAEERQQLDIALRHLGICYDVCHQAVEYEEIAKSVQDLSAAGIRINKMHLTCALHVDRPGERPAARDQLAGFVEPRYLHQTFARHADGGLTHRLDLTRELCESPAEPFLGADSWRVHFHVPVHRDQLGELQTTRAELKQGIAAAAALEYAPHLEVETYTWGVLPGEQPPSLTDGIVSELSATAVLIAAQRGSGTVPGTGSETPASA